MTDPEILDRATALDRVLFSTDEDLIVEARRRQRQGVRFAGVVYAPQELPISMCIEQLELVVKAGKLSDFVDSLLFLPLR